MRSPATEELPPSPQKEKARLALTREAELKEFF